MNFDDGVDFSSRPPKKIPLTNEGLLWFLSWGLFQLIGWQAEGGRRLKFKRVVWPQFACHFLRMGFVGWVRPSFKISHFKFALVILWHTFLGVVELKNIFYSPQPAFCHILLACLTDALFARGGPPMREAMGVMSCRLGILAFVCIRKYWICAFYQLFVRCAPSKFFNSCSFVSLSVLYAT